MTEAEWLAGTNLLDMLRHLQANYVSTRKYQLAAGAFCRRIEAVLPDEMCWRAITAVERVANGEAPQQEARDFRKPMSDLLARLIEACGAAAREGTAEQRFATSRNYRAARAVYEASGLHEHQMANIANDASAAALSTDREILAQKWILHDIYGNPFRPIAFAPAWRSDTALSLARVMYESRDFAAMPILADALMDAGCDHADVLNHCRGSGPHVRGCWVVDLVLGKK